MPGAPPLGFLPMPIFAEDLTGRKFLLAPAEPGRAAMCVPGR